MRLLNRRPPSGPHRGCTPDRFPLRFAIATRRGPPSPGGLSGLFRGSDPDYSDRIPSWAKVNLRLSCGGTHGQAPHPIPGLPLPQALAHSAVPQIPLHRVVQRVGWAMGPCPTSGPTRDVCLGHVEHVALLSCVRRRSDGSHEKSGEAATRYKKS